MGNILRNSSFLNFCNLIYAFNKLKLTLKKITRGEILNVGGTEKTWDLEGRNITWYSENYYLNTYLSATKKLIQNMNFRARIVHFSSPLIKEYVKTYSW